MRTTMLLGALLAGAALMFVQCTAHDDSARLDDDAGDDDASDSSSDVELDADARVDAQPDVDATAAPNDDFEVPDGNVVCEVSPCAVAITGGSSSFCALLDDKTVQCWGFDGTQQVLGYQSDTYFFSPMFTYASSPRRLDLSNIVSLSLSSGGFADTKGVSNGCAVDEGGSVYCWGSQALVNVGNDPDAGAAEPVSPTRVALVPSASSVAVGGGTACVTTRAGTLSCWGNNESGQLAHISPTATPFSPPVDIPLEGALPLKPWPNSSMFATTADGKLFAWGLTRLPLPPAEYLLGFETSEDFDVTPTLVPSLSGVRAVASNGTNHNCAIVGRHVECWGENSSGQLGLGVASKGSQLPARTILSQITDADDLDAGNPDGGDVPLQVHNVATGTCALMGSGRIYCWGRGVQMADSTQYPILKRVDGPSDVVDFVASQLGTFCALRRTGEVDCWGTNQFGELGRGNDDYTFSDDTPAPVVFEQ